MDLRWNAEGDAPEFDGNAEIERLRAAIARVRALHSREECHPHYPLCGGTDTTRTIVYCAECGGEDGPAVDWPCRTIQSLDGDT